MSRNHPENLPFEPSGPGFTESDNVHNVYHRPLLLTEHNIEAIRNNHPGDWADAFASLPEQARDRYGKRTGLTDDERRRLATLATLVEQHMYDEDRMVVVGPRLIASEGSDLDGHD